MDDQEIREHYADGGTPEMLMLTYFLRVVSEAGSILDEYRSFLEQFMKQVNEDSSEYTDFQKRINRIDALKEEMSSPPGIDSIRRQK